MSLRPTSSAKYLGHTIDIQGVTSSDFPGLVAFVDIGDASGRMICRFTELLDRFLQDQSTGWAQNDEEATKQLMERAFHRARGAILLGRVQELHSTRFLVPAKVTFAERSDEYLRTLVLNAFKRVYRHDPSQEGRIDFDDIGVALLEDVNPKDIEYILHRLDGDVLIQVSGAGHKPGARWYEPTAMGLTQADRLSMPSRAPAFLVEETVAKVETTLDRYDRELADALRRQSIRVAEAEDLGEHEVGEVAQACEQVIWDFLHLDVLWEGITANRPPKDKTRDRVRLLLEARSPSGTEASLLEGLEQYLVGWFGPLEEFVHKHRHLPGESDRRQARRCVVYTYLFLADLIEVLGL